MKPERELHLRGTFAFGTNEIERGQALLDVLCRVIRAMRLRVSLVKVVEEPGRRGQSQLLPWQFEALAGESHPHIIAPMSIGYVRALRILHRAFRHYPPSERLHILIRFLTCPFTRTVDDVPRGARVLDIGSGHALYGVLLVDARAAEVVAVDPDVRKSLLPAPAPRIRKVAGYDDCVAGTFDAIVVYDATYRMSLDVRRELFERVLKRLKPGGVFLWKDMDPAHPLKMKWARFQEWLSDRLLGISLGEGFLHQTREEVAAMLTEIGFVDLEARAIDRGYVHPHMLYTAKRPVS